MRLAVEATADPAYQRAHHPLPATQLTSTAGGNVFERNEVWSHRGSLLATAELILNYPIAGQRPNPTEERTMSTDTTSQIVTPARAKAFMADIGFIIDELTGSRVTAHLELGPEHHTPWGLVNGGVYCTAIEGTASIGASAAVQDQDKFAVGLTNTTHFLRPITAGTVTVDAVALNQGRTQQLWRVDVTDETGRLIAHGEVRLQNIYTANAKPGTPA